MVQFDQVLNRKGTNCAKWDHQGGDGSILYSTPMYTHIRRLHFTSAVRALAVY